jgi:hypothetical protein
LRTLRRKKIKRQGAGSLNIRKGFYKNKIGAKLGDAQRAGRHKKLGRVAGDIQDFFQVLLT